MPLGLLGLLGIFLIFGMFFGLIRGLKRSSIRLATVLVALLLAFLLTPVIGRALTSINIPINGKTPSEWMDMLANQIGENAFYLESVMPHLQDFLVAAALAVVNLVLFLVLYIVVKILSWIVYAILAPICAPKKDKDGKRYKKHAWFGLLVGAVQGLVLFFFFMIPVNGLIGVAGQVAGYQALGGVKLTPADQTVATAAMDEDESGMDMVQTVKDVDDALGTYKLVLRYSGMEWLSKQALAYQTTIRVKGAKGMCLSKDLATGLELFADVQAMRPTIDRLNRAYEDAGDMATALAVLDENDYTALRYLVDKFFSLEVLRFGDVLLDNLDQILAKDFYPMLADNYAAEGYQDEFIDGVSAMVQYLAQTKLGVLHDDLLAMLKTMQTWYGTEVTLTDHETEDTVTMPLPMALARQNLTTADYLDIFLSPVGEDDTALGVVVDSIFDLQLFKLISQPKAENVVLYGNFMDNLTAMDEQYPGFSDFARTFVASFMGTKAAMGPTENPGTWQKLRNLSVNVLAVLRDHIDIAAELNRITEELRAEQPDDADESMLMPQAIMTYLSGLLGKGDNITDDEKYAKIDRLAVALHQLIFTFDGVADFASAQVAHMNLGEIGNILTPLFESSADEGKWKTAFRSIVNMADLLSKSQAIFDSVLSTDFSDPDSVKDLLEQLVGTDGTDGLLNAKDVADVVFDLLQSEQIQETVDQFLDNLGDSLRESFAGDDAMNEVLDKLDEALGDLQNMEKAELEDLFADLWEQLSKSINNGSSTQGA